MEETPKTMLGNSGQITENIWFDYETKNGVVVIANSDGLDELTENDLINFRWNYDEFNFMDITYIYDRIQPLSFGRYRLFFSARSETITEIRP